MTKRLPVESTPGFLEGYAALLDDLFRARAQREGSRRYLEGLLLPVKRNKILTALANTEPVAGAQRREAQRRACNGFLRNQGATRARPTGAISNSCSTISPPPRTRRASWSSTSTGIASGASAPPTSAGSA